MIMIQSQLVLLVLASIATSSSSGIRSSGIRELRSIETVPIRIAANVSYTQNTKSSGLASLFSPRMDFEQWKPLTGRGDPLRNDPTYDYEPPVLERVHYWADETRLEREHFPERKSEVLMLGVSSRKPSVTSRPPPLPPRRQQNRPLPPKYEDFTYKLSEHYPMTILVPPPPPPPGHQPSLFLLSEEKLTPPNSHIKLADPPKYIVNNSTIAPETLTSSFALQEANLIYQSSTTNQNWILDLNQTKAPQANAISSDYAGWGPTTPIHEEVSNDSPNLISHNYVESTQQPYSFYKPMLSEAPPPPKVTASPLLLPTFLPTVLPATTAAPDVNSYTEVTWPTEQTSYEVTTENQDYYEEITTEKQTTKPFVFVPTPVPHDPTVPPKLEATIFDMLGPMMTMPMVNGPERPEDNLYAHASENIHVFQNQNSDDVTKLETMQTMQPPPPGKISDSISQDPLHDFNNLQFNQPSVHTHDPYLHMRYTTPTPTTESAARTPDRNKSSTEAPIVPMYLIIQGHSKVKTYSSKNKKSEDNHTISNEIPKPNETNEVKHLHPFKHKNAKKIDEKDDRTSRAKNLKSLIEYGLGSIEIQETDVGIKYDVSDGSDVPVEIYRKGLVDSEENNYPSTKKISKGNRTKRQIDIEDLLPFDEDTIEDYVYNFLEGKRNETSITGLIAQAVTSDVGAAVDDLEEDNDNSEQDDEER